MNRRGFLSAILATACAPAIAKSQSLMKIYVPQNDIILLNDGVDFHNDFNLGDGDFTVEGFFYFDNCRQHTAITKRDGDLHGYQNGELKTPQEFQKVWNVIREPMSTYTGGLVKSHAKSPHFNGYIDEVKVLNIAIAPPQIKTRAQQIRQPHLLLSQNIGLNIL